MPITLVYLGDLFAGENILALSCAVRHATVAGGIGARQATYGMLRTVFNTATADGVFSTNPATIKGGSAQRTKRQATILTVDEMWQLADGVGERLRAWVLIAALCGLRFGEAVELRRKDIADDYTTITVARSVRHVGGCKISDGTKNGETRRVPVPEAMRVDLKHHMDTQVAPGPDALLFPSTTGRCHLSDDQVRGALAPVLAGIGKPDMLIYQQVASGRPAEVAQQLSARVERPRKTA
jgi:integrase